MKRSKSAINTFKELEAKYPDNYGEVINTIQKCPVLSYMIEKNIQRGCND